jgi:hypothetical protein
VAARHEDQRSLRRGRDSGGARLDGGGGARVPADPSGSTGPVAGRDRSVRSIVRGGVERGAAGDREQRAHQALVACRDRPVGAADGWHRLRFAPAEDAFGFTQFMQVARIEYAAAVERERLASNDEREGLLAIPQTTADLTRRYLAARADGDEAAAAQLQNAIVESMVGAKPREVASGQRNLLTSGGDEGAPNVMEEAAKVLAITGPRQRGVIGSTRHLTAEELQERVAAEIADRAPRATKLAQQVRERDGEA